MAQAIFRNGLMLFSNDLRLHDNPALHQAFTSSDKLACVFIVNPRWFARDRFGCCQLGTNRWRFLLESLADLEASLLARGQRLWVLRGDPTEVLPAIVDANDIDAIYVSDESMSRLEHHATGMTVGLEQALLEVFPRLAIFRGQPNTLFSESSLGFPLQQLPQSFTPFRKKVEKLATLEPTSFPVNEPGLLPLDCRHFAIDDPQVISYLNLERTLAYRPGYHSGGETAALLQLQGYFGSYWPGPSGQWHTRGHIESEAPPPSTYKETRNELSGWSNSTKFSAWLANGSLSVRTLRQALLDFEQNVVANESSYWILFELLWREYFYWYTKLHGEHAVAFDGVRAKKPLLSFYPERFRQWCSGSTRWPLVNAGIRELNTTGYTSNRMRQILASCLVNELQVDWRAGAHFFMQQLVDYDAASNWGNWQYIAGVGADPRGGRHFNIEKQASTFDPTGAYTDEWAGPAAQATPASASIDSVDAADWPISDPAR